MFLLGIRTTNIEMLDREKIMFELHQQLIFDSHEIAVVIVMINHISYDLNLVYIVSITWGMSSPGLEEGR